MRSTRNPVHIRERYELPGSKLEPHPGTRMYGYEHVFRKYNLYLYIERDFEQLPESAMMNASVPRTQGQYRTRGFLLLLSRKKMLISNYFDLRTTVKIC